MPHQDGKPVLIVDDDDSTREALRVTLEVAGFPVEEAANGKEALEKIRIGIDPCLILLDLMMPVMSGLEFRGHQVEDASMAKIPVILYSALPDVKQIASQVDALMGLQKPLNAAAIIDAIKRYC